MPYTVYAFILVTFIIHRTYGSIGPAPVGLMLPMNPHFIGPPLPPPHMIHEPLMGPVPMMNGPLPPSMQTIMGPLPSAMMFGPHIKNVIPSPPHFLMKSSPREPRKMATMKRKMSPSSPRKRMVKRPRRVIIVRKFPRGWRSSYGHEHGGQRGRRPLRYYDGYDESFTRSSNLFDLSYRSSRNRNAFNKRSDRINSFEPKRKSFDGNNGGNVFISDPFSSTDIFKPARFSRNNDAINKKTPPVERNNVDGNSISKSYPKLDTFSKTNWNHIDDTVISGPGLNLSPTNSLSSKMTPSGTTLREKESMVNFNNRKTENWKQPRLLETQDKGNRIEARRTTMESGQFQNSNRPQSLSGNTLDFSTLISSIQSSGTDTAEQTLDNNNQKVSIEHIPFEKNSGTINNDVVQLTDVEAPKRLKGVKPFEPNLGFAGSLIDFTTNNNNGKVKNDATVKVGEKVAIKTGSTSPQPEKQKLNVPLAKDPMVDAPLVIVDETVGDGGIGQYNVVTLQEGQFAALESVLQSGQAVSEEMINSIIGGSTGSAVESIKVSSQDPLIADAGLVANQVALDTAPQIYILNGKQAKQIAGAADLSASGLDPALLKSVVAQASIGTSGEQHPGTVVPHLSHSGHGIVGVVGEPVSTFTVQEKKDIVGLFSVPGDHHSPKIPASVTNIPKSIGSRMHHPGKPHCK